jgi:hypothetical protein
MARGGPPSRRWAYPSARGGACLKICLAWCQWEAQSSTTRSLSPGPRQRSHHRNTAGTSQVGKGLARLATGVPSRCAPRSSRASPNVQATQVFGVGGCSGDGPSRSPSAEIPPPSRYHRATSGARHCGAGNGGLRRRDGPPRPTCGYQSRRDGWSVTARRAH